jgi:hypothetical protein
VRRICRDERRRTEGYQLRRCGTPHRDRLNADRFAFIGQALSEGIHVRRADRRGAALLMAPVWCWPVNFDGRREARA